MLCHQTQDTDSVHTATPVSRISLQAGKSGMPYIGKGTVAYPNRYSTIGQVSRVTIIESVPGGKYTIKVVQRGGNRKVTVGTEANEFQSKVARNEQNLENLETLYFEETTVQGIAFHVFQDLQAGNDRLYRADGPAKTGNDGKVEFSDGVSALLFALELMTGHSFDSRFAPCSRSVGCSSNMPTLQKVVHGQASRHVRVRRPSGSKSFSSGMPTNAQGGAKLPSQSEQIKRNMMASKRNLELAVQADEAGKSGEAEERFLIAADYESRAAAGRSLVNERMALLRERAAIARANKKAQADTEENAA